MFRVLFNPASDMYEVCDDDSGLSAIAAFADNADAHAFASELAALRAEEYETYVAMAA